GSGGTRGRLSPRIPRTSRPAPAATLGLNPGRDRSSSRTRLDDGTHARGGPDGGDLGGHGRSSALEGPGVDVIEVGRGGRGLGSGRRIPVDTRRTTGPAR